MTDFTLVASGICYSIELTAKNDELEIAITNDCDLDHPDGIGLSLNKEKVTQLCGFLNEWLENGGFVVPQPIDEE